MALSVAYVPAIDVDAESRFQRDIVDAMNAAVT